MRDDATVTVASAVASFALVAGLLTIVPGLDTALVLRTAVARGRRHAYATALGINTGALVWGAGAAVGVTALLTASQTAYTVVRFAGAGYMVWLGGRMLWGAWLRRREDVTDPTVETERPAPEGGLVRSWAVGVGTNLLNPKVGAFYVAMFPQFIPPDTAHLPMGLLLALVHDVEGMAWFTLLILGVHVARHRLAQAWVRRAMDTAAGTVLVGFGVRLALSER